MSRLSPWCSGFDFASRGGVLPPDKSKEFCLGFRAFHSRRVAAKPPVRGVSVLSDVDKYKAAKDGY